MRRQMVITMYNNFTQLQESQWVDAKWGLKLSKALFTSQQVPLQPAVTSEMFQVGLPCYPGRTELMPVSFNKRQQNEEAFLQKHSWRAHVYLMFPSFPYGKHCFQDANYAYATLQGILTKIRVCEHLQKFCEHEQASTSLIFASNSSKGQILRVLSNWMGPFDTPYISDACRDLTDV